MNLTVLAVILSCGGAPQESAEPSLTVMKKRREALGAAVLIEELYDQGQWQAILEQISERGGDWMNFAAALRKVADGGSAFDLDIAAAEALQTSPEAVLASIGSGFHVEVVCHHEDSLGDNYEQALKRIETRRSALTTVKDEALKPVRDRCLAELQGLEAEVREHRKEWFPQ